LRGLQILMFCRFDLFLIFLWDIVGQDLMVAPWSVSVLREGSSGYF
jgi:hypothetical protein